jgi:hypothetical protein
MFMTFETIAVMHCYGWQRVFRQLLLLLVFLMFAIAKTLLNQSPEPSAVGAGSFAPGHV